MVPIPLVGEARAPALTPHHMPKSRVGARRMHREEVNRSQCMSVASCAARLSAQPRASAPAATE
jgi:hypothetical protein